MTGQHSGAYVIAVGIGTYKGLGEESKLPQAAEHAVRFAEWACRAGVPPRNVYLFLSDPERRQLAMRLAESKLDARPATAAGFRHFMEEDLRSLSGTTLHLFWTGHGGSGRNPARELLYQDAKIDDPRRVVLDNLMECLRSQPYGRIPEQYLYIDACANREPLFLVSGGDDRFAVVRQHNNINQSCAVSAGTFRQVSAGRFSQYLLEELESRAAAFGSWRDQHDAILNALEKGRGAKPGDLSVYTQLCYTNGRQYSADSTELDLPEAQYINDVALRRGCNVRWFDHLAIIAASYHAFNGPRGHANRTRLFAKLKGLGGASRAGRSTAKDKPVDDLRYIVAWAFENGAAASLAKFVLQIYPDGVHFDNEVRRIRAFKNAYAILSKLAVDTRELRPLFLHSISAFAREPGRVEVATIEDMLEEFLQVRPTSGVVGEPVLEFMLRIADRYQEYSRECRQFVQRHTNSPAILARIESRLITEQRFLLSVSVRVSFTDDTAFIDGILVETNGPRMMQPFAPASHANWGQAEAGVAAMVQEARRMVFDGLESGGGERPEENLDVEFLLPAQWYFKHPHRIRVPLADDVEVPLGTLHSVVIRSRSRVLERSSTDRTSWKEIAGRVDRTKPARILWLHPGERNTTGLRDRCEGILAFAFYPGSDISAIMKAGFPFAAWRSAASPEDAWNASFIEEFEAWAGSAAFQELPRALRTARRHDIEWSDHLTLFWDDPECASHWRLRDVVTPRGFGG